MGKSCIRFKKPEHIPYALIGALAAKMTHEEWITIYEKLKTSDMFFFGKSISNSVSTVFEM